MLRNRLPNQQFSPRLSSVHKAAAAPPRLNEVRELLVGAGVTPSRNLGGIHRGSWHDKTLAIENLAKQVCTSAESAIISVTIGARCSRREAPSEGVISDIDSNEPPKRRPQGDRVDSPLLGERDTQFQ